MSCDVGTGDKSLRHGTEVDVAPDGPAFNRSSASLKSNRLLLIHGLDVSGGVFEWVFES